ncbi:hypothetical protein ACFVFQ_31320 [Streptomyces sp. NPDC057743]|uniref:Rv1733c family protein n=1 Tax=Streptomyces sp. NPDC057743 TaxID=3346236 RepID=UPI0036CB965B
MPLPKPHPPWRHVPLRRGTDVLQSWMTLLAGLLILVGAPIVGVVAGLATTTAADHQHAAWRRSSAVVVQQPSVPVGIETGTGSAGGQVFAKVRWVARGHTPRTGETAVAPGARVGDRAPVWLDRHGALVRDPGSPTDTMAMGTVVGIAAGCGAGLLIFSVDKIGVCVLDRRRSAQWEREWETLDAQWRHHRQ